VPSTVSIRISDDERGQLDDNAAAAGLTISAFVRLQVFGDGPGTLPALATLERRMGRHFQETSELLDGWNEGVHARLTDVEQRLSNLESLAQRAGAM
jgi:hypothetical protein